MTAWWSLIVVIVIVTLFVWVPTTYLRRRHVKQHGTSDVVVRCAQGHLYTSIWIPGVSLKSVRLGLRRYQRCPVGRHWSMTVAVPLDELSDAQRIEAARVHDLRIP